jgi:SAM-dependent methyltransferase
VPEEPVSRRGLFSLGWPRAAARGSSPGAALDAYAEGRLAAWEAGATALHTALAPLHDVLCERAGAGPDRELLEVDAGEGTLSAAAARRGAVLTACDPSPVLVDAGREQAEDEGLDVLWETAGSDALPFADGAFDAVLSLYGTIWAARPRRTLRELLRVLRPDGALVLAAPAPRSFLAAALELAARPAPPDPAVWGDPEAMRERVAAVAPAATVEAAEVPFALEWPSEAEAWAACRPVFALGPGARDPFARLVSSRSTELSRVSIPERASLIVVRPGA